MPEALLTRHSRMLNRMDYDFTNQPDLAQTLIAVCPILGIPFHFTGLRTLKIKETDRIEAMKREMESWDISSMRKRGRHYHGLVNVVNP